MKRKNMGNQAIIKAITIGLSAVMATAQPITVLAEESTDVQPSENVTVLDKDIEGGIADAAQEAVDAVDESIDSSKLTETDAKDALADVAKEQATEFTEGEAGQNEAGEDNAKKVDDAIDVVAEDTALDSVVEKMELIDNDLVIVENVDAQENKLAEETVDQVEAAVKVAEDITTYMDEATTNAESLHDDIVNAKTIKDAKDAYNELTELAAKAAEEVTKATENFATIEEKYNAAKEQLLAAAKTYNAIVAHASGEADAAKEALDAAEQKVAALQEAVDDAKEGVKATNEGALKIMAIQQEVADNTAVNWTKEDKLFNAIVENYYVSAIEEGATDVKSERIKGADNDSYNYFKVTYKDADGVEQTKYLNYKMEDKSNCNIVIFEKTADEVAAADHLNNYINTNKITDDKKKKAVIDSGVFSYEDEDGNIQYITGTELDAMGTGVVTVDGVKYITGTAGTKEVKVTPVVAPAKTDLDVNETAEEVEIATSTKHFELRDGVLTLVETADVTRTDYQRLNSDLTEYKKDGYTEAEKNALIAALGDNVSFAEVVDVEQTDENGNPIKYYVLTGTSYVPTFTANGINVNRRCNNKNGETKAVNEVVDQINGQNYTIINNNLSAKHDGSILKVGDEDYQVTGSVTVVINECQVKLKAEDFTTGEYTSEAAAKAALEKLVKGYLSKDGVKATVNVDSEYDGNNWAWKIGKTERTDEISTSESYKDLKYSEDEYSKYACYIDYLKMISSKSANEEISVEEYNEAAAISAAIVQNKEYIAKHFGLVESTDEGLSDFLNAAQDLVDKYDRIGKEADAAQEKLEASEAKVDDLSKAIDDLKNQDNKIITAIEALGVEDLASYLGIEVDKEEAAKLNDMTLDEAIKYLDDKLEDAKDDLDQAKIKVEDLQDKLDEAEDDLKKTIRKLTPPTPVDEDDNTPAADDEDDTTVVAVLPTATGDTTVDLNLLMANAPRAGAVAGANREEVTEIGENEIPLAATVEETKPEETKETKVTEIGENEVPLAGNVINEEQTRSWWWLILVAIATALGFGSYKYYDSKKKEKVTPDSEK